MTQTIDSGATETRRPAGAGSCGTPGDTNPRKTDSAGTPVFVGYARLSTAEQLIDRQIDALRDAGCQRIFIDHGVTGVRMDRPELQAALAWMRPGDVLAIMSLDRLGRNVRGVLKLVDDLERHGMGLRVLQLGLDTSTPSGRLVLTVLLAVAQLERDHLSERTRDGLAAARRRGRVGGRPRALSENQIRAVRAMRSDGASIAECAEAFEVSTRTITRVTAPR
ncbi:recombinase family protein [Dermacoccus sp. NHGro5]|uniref:recombinase family protein n=1 Tax=Dermacoccus TaxID=57495 RepID=UPI001AA16F6D|nr:recombinase family protein [Dermacoccus sp. NHGro5]MBO1757105.1 recombinase family protein [Dermacoccus sp. NHGro5]